MRQQRKAYALLILASISLSLFNGASEGIRVPDLCLSAFEAEAGPPRGNKSDGPPKIIVDLSGSPHYQEAFAARARVIHRSP